jgi:tyrosyl-tRNA synthetase
LGLKDILKLTGKFRWNNVLSAKVFAERKSGFSFAETLYPLLQAYDFQYLHKNLNVNAQLAGHDQEFNILQGIKIINSPSYGILLPLLTVNQKKISKTDLIAP